MSLENQHLPQRMREANYPKLSVYSSNFYETERNIKFDETQSSGTISLLFNISSSERIQPSLTGITGIEFEDRLNLLRSPGITVHFLLQTERIFPEKIEKDFKKIYKSKSDEILLDKLLDFSSKLKYTRNEKEKVQLLIELNNFMKDNKEIIKSKYSDIIVSILNSL